MAACLIIHITNGNFIIKTTISMVVWIVPNFPVQSTRDPKKTPRVHMYFLILSQIPD